MRRRHLENARRGVRRAADATDVQELDDELDSIHEALGDLDRWEDGRRERPERIRDQLAEVEEPLRDDVRQARASLLAYGRRSGR